jgi:hypothetical protein
MTKKLFAFLFFVLMAGALRAQSYRIEANNTPLSSLLVSLRDQFQLLTSFDDQLLSQYIINLDSSFSSKEDIIKALIDPLPLDYEKENQVFVIFPQSRKKTKKTTNQLVTGYIFDQRSREALPYSHLIIDGHGFVSDQNGYFSILISKDDSLLPIRVSHLGYYLLDTLLPQAQNIRLPLQASSIKLMEVKIVGHPIDFNSQLGQQAGIVTLNSQISRHLPGFGDNSVFNLLRLQAGILASGEQTNDLIIWGSYEGQSKVMFDGFTVYGLKNFNDNISAFNPYMAKDVKIMKGGYDARYGGRVGGIIDITGINGNRNKPSFSLNVNNMTLNGLLEIPMGKRAALVAAFRQTYFNLYNPTQYSLKRRDTTNQVYTINLDVIPKYSFHDFNIKYAGTSKNNDSYFISLYGGADRFVYNISQALIVNRFLKETGEQNRQGGGSFFYGKKWKKGGTSHLSLSLSHLTNDYSDKVKIQKIKTGKIVQTWRATEATNQIDELTARIDNHLPISTSQQLEFGLAMLVNQSQNREDTFGIVRSNLKMEGHHLVIYGQDVIGFGSKLHLKAGSRAQYAFKLRKYYFDPRLSLHFTPTSHWKINLAWGIYHQFIAKSSVLDDEGNYRYVWAVADNVDIPVLKSVHHVFEINFFQNNFTFNLQAYYKSIDGLARYMRYRKIVPPDIYHGYGRSYGIDVTIKKEYKGSSAWLAYSLGKTEEVFDYFPDKQYRRAPQDQRHELKAAIMLDFNPVYLSADYVYGSGFPANISQEGRTQDDEPYKRLDIALSYRFLNKKVKGEAGLSVMNVLNTHNIKFSKFERVPYDQTNTINIFADAMPRTPSLYLNISL